MSFLRRRFYVVGEDVVMQHLDTFYSAAGVTWLPLYDDAIAGDRDRWELAGKPVLLNAVFRHEILQDRFHAHPGVAIFPHPVHEGTDKLKTHIGKVGRKIKAAHIAHLAALGITGEHTVQDLEAAAVARNLGMNLRALL